MGEGDFSIVKGFSFSKTEAAQQFSGASVYR
jgi:hypothetical protein